MGVTTRKEIDGVHTQGKWWWCMYHTAGVEGYYAVRLTFILGFPEVVVSELIGGLCLDGDWPTGGRIINRSLIKATLGLTFEQCLSSFQHEADVHGSIWSPHV